MNLNLDLDHFADIVTAFPFEFILHYLSYECLERKKPIILEEKKFEYADEADHYCHLSYSSHFTFSTDA